MKLVIRLLSLFLLSQIVMTKSVFAKDVAAVYEVPVSDTNFIGSNRFSIQKASINNYSNGLMMVQYMVPQELTGAPNFLKFIGQMTNGQGDLESATSVMNCKNLKTELNCSIEYQKLNFDSSLANDALKSKFSGAELLKRQMIQTHFSTDPVGIIHFRK